LFDGGVEEMVTGMGEINVELRMWRCGNVEMWKCENVPGVVISNGVRQRRTK